MKRDEISSNYQWNLTDIYASNDLLENDFNIVIKLTHDIKKYEGIVTESSVSLLNCLRDYENLSKLSDKIFNYAKMLVDQDTSNSTNQEIAKNSIKLFKTVLQSCSFIVPEILHEDNTKINGFLDELADLSTYKRFIIEIQRQEQYTLSPKEEQILADAYSMANLAGNTFAMLNYADLKFPLVKTESGKEIELTLSNYVTLLNSSNNEVRKSTYHALYEGYDRYKNTITKLFIGNIKKNVFYKKTRNYNSCLEMELFIDNIKPSTYDLLIAIVNKRISALHKYFAIKKPLLNLAEFNIYDLLLSPQKPKRAIPYKEALRIVENGLGILGAEYIETLKIAFDKRWIDIYENEYKSANSYCSGAYDTHPYVLLNYKSTIDDVFTIAREMGYALHKHYTNTNQVFINSQPKPFIADIAPNVNEILIFYYIIENSTDKTEKIYLINHCLDKVANFLFKQVLISEFEKIVYEVAEKNEPMSLIGFNNIYYNLIQKYYGPHVILDNNIMMEWLRNPQLYTSFNVYKYAVSLCFAISIATDILNNKNDLTQNYIEFLKTGVSDNPSELLIKLDVDIESPQPIEKSIDFFENLLIKLEDLLSGN